MGAEARLIELKLVLPPAPKPVATYVTAARHGDLLYISGHGPLRADGTMIVGRLGADMDVAAGQAAARQTGLAILSTLDKGVGQTTLEFKISLLRPITPETGLITAEGVVLSRGRRVGTAEGRITDSKGRLLVHGTTTCLIFER